MWAKAEVKARLCTPLTAEQIVQQFIPSEMPEMQLVVGRRRRRRMLSGGCRMQDGRLVPECRLLDAG